MKQLQNNFTTLEQSKRLLELGVPADSADCFFYLNTDDSDNPHILYKKLSEKQADYDSPFSSIKTLLYPCWSVGRLMEIFDICYQREPEEHITEHWILTQEAIENFGSYIEYLVQTFSVQKKFLNFSKLEN